MNCLASLPRSMLVAAIASAWACADDVPPLDVVDREPDGGVDGQLTFNVGDDRSPAWSSTGDSIYYTAEGLDHLPHDPSVLVGLPISGGGIATTILTNVQLEGDLDQEWLVWPTPDPTGERLAYVEIVSLWVADLCPDALLVCDPERAREEVLLPPVRQIALRVRDFAATGPISDDPALELDSPGAQFIDFEARNFVVENHPYQQLFDEEDAFTFRASWAPDGERLAFSDGLDVMIWNVEGNTADTVPNTRDGVWPAWSPDGEWIAFTRLERVDSSGVSCIYLAFGPQCWQERTDYVPGLHALSLIRPDGSDLRELGEGDEPAWAPDGSLIYFRHDNRIWNVHPDGSGIMEVPGTEGGREPAVSPDGSRLAFARVSRAGDYDIWIINLGA